MGDAYTVKSFSGISIATSSTDTYTGISCGDYTVDVYVDKGSGKNLEPTIFDVDSTAKSITYPKGLTSADAGTWSIFYKVKLKDYPTQ